MPTVEKGHGELYSASRLGQLVREDALEEYCMELLAPLSRRDQRRWGWLYIRGLLLAEGRKSMRSIAVTCHQPASQQNLQQFVSNSTWQWSDVRQRLARVICQNIKATAWVISPLVIPKAGNETVGVDTQYVSYLGKLVNCQRALGIWLATPGASFPIDWHMVLPPAWTGDAFRRRRASIPEHVKGEPAWEVSLEALITIINDWGLPMRPVVVDARETESAAMMREMQRLQIPFIARVDRSTPFVQTGKNGARRGADLEYTAESLARYLKEQRRVVPWQDSEHGVQQGVLAAAVRVDLPDERIGVGGPGSAFMAISNELPPGQQTLVLIAEWRDSVQGRPSFWVSNITRMSLSALINCANQTQKVHRDQERISRQVGLYDFEGRSFKGWHRHVTLVSAAHAFIVLNGLHNLLGGGPGTALVPNAWNAKSPWQET